MHGPAAAPVSGPAEGRPVSGRPGAHEGPLPPSGCGPCVREVPQEGTRGCQSTRTAPVGGSYDSGFSATPVDGFCAPTNMPSPT